MRVQRLAKFFEMEAELACQHGFDVRFKAMQYLLQLLLTQRTRRWSNRLGQDGFNVCLEIMQYLLQFIIHQVNQYLKILRKRYIDME